MKARVMGMTNGAVKQEQHETEEEKIRRKAKLPRQRHAIKSVGDQFEVEARHAPLPGLLESHETSSSASLAARATPRCTAPPPPRAYAACIKADAFVCDDKQPCAFGCKGIIVYHETAEHHRVSQGRLLDEFTTAHGRTNEAVDGEVVLRATKFV
ncbi:hypothetical protein EJB05_35046, partial [Eragrostis curvula]